MPYNAKPHIKTDDMKVLYDKGLSCTQIANQLGLAKSSVSRRLKKSGITLRKTDDYSREKRYWLWKGDNYLDPVTRKRNQRKHRVWSNKVKERDGFICTNCKNKHHRLHAHHIISIRECLDSNLEFDVDNGLTLCSKCHGAIHRK